LAIYSQAAKKEKKEKKKTGSRIPATLNFAQVRKKKMQKGQKGRRGKKKRRRRVEKRRKTRKMCSACDGYFVLRALQSAASSEPDVLIESKR